MSEEENVKELLEKVSTIIQNRDREFQTGKKFNAFNMAQIGSEETRHSAIIAELLNPRSCFGKGAEPLKAFFRQIGLDEIAEQCTEQTEVDTEYSIIGRRMDIVIRNESICVVIENKTVTVDHERQLADYKTWLDGQTQIHKQLLYLTYHGDRAVNYSGKDYIAVSYRTHICNWLRECALMSIDNMANSIFCSQYSEFITNTLLEENKKMNEISSVLNNLENFQLAEKISNAYHALKAEKYTEIFREWIKIQNGKGIESFSEDVCADHASGFSFIGNDELLIGFRFNKTGFRELFYGLTWRDLKEHKLDEINKKYESKGNWERSTWWPYYKSISGKYENPGEHLEFLFDEKEELFKQLDCAFKEAQELLQEIQQQISK